jgi:hypothetical protein
MVNLKQWDDALKELGRTMTDKDRYRIGWTIVAYGAATTAVDVIGAIKLHNQFFAVMAFLIAASTVYLIARIIRYGSRKRPC